MMKNVEWKMKNEGEVINEKEYKMICPETNPIPVDKSVFCNKSYLN